jgi:hypothetical protein
MPAVGVIFFVLLGLWVFSKLMDTETGGKFFAGIFVALLNSSLIFWVILFGLLFFFSI